MFNKKPIGQSVFNTGKSENGNQFGNTGYKSNYDVSKIGNLEKYKIREGLNKIDIIPFNAGPTHPLVISKQCDPDDAVYSVDYFVHKGIGPTGSDFTCLKQYGQNCPICNESRRNWEIGTEDSKKIATALRNKRRCIYVVHDLIDGKYYYLDQAWFSFEKLVNARAAITIDPATNAPVNPFDWQSGKTITFYGKKDAYKGKDYIKVDEGTFGFLDRQSLSDEVLDHGVDLSVGIIVPTEQELDNVLCGKVTVSTEQTVQNVAPSKVEQQTNPNVTQQSFQNMQPVTTESLASEALNGSSQPAQNTNPTEGKVCPFAHCWGEADKHPECSTCSAWENCIDDSPEE